jgi:hypothetical protein
VGDVVADAAQQQVGERGVAPRAHHDLRAVMVLGELDDVGTRISLPLNDVVAGIIACLRGERGFCSC